MRAPDATVDLEGIDPDVYAKRWRTLAVLCTSLTIVIIGNTVLNVALPTLQRPVELGGLGATNTQVQWIVDAYALVFAGLLFTAAALGDRFGRKGALQAGLFVFAIGSVMGAMADTSTALIVARAVMGTGAAFVMPSTLSILTNVFPSGERAKAIAIWAGISGSGAALGPLTSGFLLEHYWWGAVFLINLPIIAVAMLAGWRLVPQSRDAGVTPLDPVGAVLSIVGLCALVYAIIEGPHHGWVSTESLLWFGGAVLALAVFVWWELRTTYPMLDLHLFTNPRFSVSSGGITLVFFAMFGTFFMLTLYLQGVLEYSPLDAAVRLLPFSVIMMTVAPQTPKLVARFGADRVGAAGLMVLAGGLAGVTQFTPETSYPQLLVTVCLMAGGMALTISPMTAQLMSAVPRDRAGMGSATNDTTRELGGALGVAVLGSLVASQYTSGMAGAVDDLPADVRDLASASIGGVLGLVDGGLLPDDQAQPLLAAAKQAFVDGLVLAGLAGTVLVVAAAILVKRFLPADRHNADIIGERAPVGSTEE